MKRTPEQIKNLILYESKERVRKAMERYELEKGLKFYDEEEFDRRIEESKPTCEQLTFLL